jgi:Plasma-membrane choline transporter
MGNPVVIQGTAVPNPATQLQPSSYDSNAYNTNGYNDGNALNRDEKQESGCKDPIFALVFYGCVIAIGAVAALYGPAAFESVSTTNSTDGSSTGGSTSSAGDEIDYSGAMTIAALLVGLSFIGAAVGMALMMMCPQFLIKTSLIFVTVLAGAMAVYSFMYVSLLGGIMGALFFALSVCYAYAVWSRIPFATVNLITACTAVRKHITVVVFSYFFAILAAGWSILWSVSFFGIFDKSYKCDANGVCNPNYGILFGMFIAFFFGHQVIQVRSIDSLFFLNFSIH